MSDAAFIGASGNPPERVKRESLHHENTPHELTDAAKRTSSTGGGSHVTAEGNLVNSDDPTTRPDASLGQKLKGDFKGAVDGTIGSLEAAAGTVFRNKDLENKGLAKMHEEDVRLGAKQGVMPVGSDRREEVIDASQADSHPAK